MPSLCSIDTQRTSLRAPGRPSAFTRNLGTMNSEMPRAPGGRLRRAREHEVDDVLGEVVLAVGDEDLLPEEAVAAVGLRHGAGAHRRQVGPGLRLGQVHGAGPFAAHHLRQVAAPSAPRNRPASARGSRPREREQSEKARFADAHISRTAAPNGLRQALSAELRLAFEPVPAALDELPVGLLEALRRASPRRRSSARPRDRRSG